MILKTEEFDRKLQADKKELLGYKGNYMYIKGSYRDKPIGSYLTDIDIVLEANYDDKNFLEMVRRILVNIGRSKNWIFLYSNQGASDEIQIPWSVTNDSSCIYDQNEAKIWFNKNKHLFSRKDIEFVAKKLFSEYISLRDIEQVYTFIYLKYKIQWKARDVFRGFIIYDNHKYDFLKMVKKRGIVFKLVYHPDENTYIPIDFAIADKKYTNKIPPPAISIRRFYTKEWYHTLKYYRRYLPKSGKIRDEYTNIMKSQEFQISLYFQLIMLSMMKSVSYDPVIVQKIFNNMEPYIRNYTLNKDIDECADIMMNIVNNSLADFIRYFSNYLVKPYTVNLFYLNRAIEANIPISQKLIAERAKKGIQCPFLVTTPEEFDIMTDIAKRSLIDAEKLIECFITVCNNTNTNMQDFLKITGNNKLSLKKLENTVILYDNEKEIDTFRINHLNILKQYILVKKVPS